MNVKSECFKLPLRIFRGGFLLLVMMAPMAVAEEYLSAEEFLHQVFGSELPAADKMWISEEQRNVAVNNIGLGRPPIRVHYWRDGKRSAWILKEIGKEKPITIGVGLNAGEVETVRILAFRESRGWEVKYPYFTDQFSGAVVDDKNHLDRRIDGITGATLSVNAVQKVVRWAAYLDRGLEPAITADAH
ncbi:MAG: FMN-binding protein [Halioglobus sp.]